MSLVPMLSTTSVAPSAPVTSPANRACGGGTAAAGSARSSFGDPGVEAVIVASPHRRRSAGRPRASVQRASASGADADAVGDRSPTADRGRAGRGANASRRLSGEPRPIVSEQCFEIYSAAPRGARATRSAAPPGVADGVGSAGSAIVAASGRRHAYHRYGVLTASAPRRDPHVAAPPAEHHQVSLRAWASAATPAPPQSACSRRAPCRSGAAAPPRAPARAAPAPPAGHAGASRPAAPRRRRTACDVARSRAAPSPAGAADTASTASGAEPVHVGEPHPHLRALVPAAGTTIRSVPPPATARGAAPGCIAPATPSPSWDRTRAAAARGRTAVPRHPHQRADQRGRRKRRPPTQHRTGRAGTCVNGTTARSGRSR